MKNSSARDYIIILFISALLVAAAYWAKNTYLDVVTLGEGRVVATGENKIVQAPQNAKITKFHVADNDTISSGEVMITLSPIQAQASLAELQTKIDNLLARKISLIGELEKKTVDDIAKSLAEFPAEISEAEVENVLAQRKELASKIATVEQNEILFAKEINALRVTIQGKSELLEIVNSEKSEIEKLLKIGAVGNSEKYKIDREQRSLEVEIASLEENIIIKNSEIEGLSKEINALQSEYDAKILREINDLEPQILELNAKKPAFEERLKDTQVIAPINGKVNKLFFNTIGAIVREGEQLVEIVPTDNELEIKGYIDPKDIGQVEPGQIARVSLTAFDPSKYGYLSGELKKISADAIYREETRSYMYEITTTVATDSFTDIDDKPIQIAPGMIAQIAIIRGERSIIDYLWQPISKTKDTAFRE
jgi:adhesin transport system membrane fusion protein